MLRRTTTTTAHKATAQYTRTLCTATTRRTTLPLLHRTTTTTIPTSSFSMTGSVRVVASRGLLLSQSTRRYLQQNAFEVTTSSPHSPPYTYCFFSFVRTIRQQTNPSLFGFALLAIVARDLQTPRQKPRNYKTYHHPNKITTILHPTHSSRKRRPDPGHHRIREDIWSPTLSPQQTAAQDLEIKCDGRRRRERYYIGGSGSESGVGVSIGRVDERVVPECG